MPLLFLSSFVKIGQNDTFCSVLLFATGIYNKICNQSCKNLRSGLKTE